MLVKQLAERLGVSVMSIDIDVRAMCKACKKLGGSNEPECEHWHCLIPAIISVAAK